jgi:hypothetical protein
MNQRSSRHAGNPLRLALSWTLVLCGIAAVGWASPPGPVTVPQDWEEVSAFTGTPDFSDPHYRTAVTHAYRFLDALGRTRHAYVIVCTGGERSTDASVERPSGEVATQEADPTAEPVKAKRLTRKSTDLTLMTIGESEADDADEEDDEEDDEEADDETPARTQE